MEAFCCRSIEQEKPEESPLFPVRPRMVISRAGLWDLRSAKLGRYGDGSAGLAEHDPAEMALYPSKIFEDLYTQQE